MKFIPILFSTPMVQAILDGRKTQTRRVIKTDAKRIEWMPIVLNGYGGFCDEHGNPVKCKYSEGDILWVREEHYRFGKWAIKGLTKSGLQKWKFIATNDQTLYFDNIPATNYKSRQANNKDGNWEEMETWYKRLPRFMPKEACRLFLKVVSIRVERLQDISEEDAKAEGVQSEFDTYRDYVDKSAIGDCYLPTAKCSFETLWESINGIESWESNPWVWVKEFERCEKPENF